MEGWLDQILQTQLEMEWYVRLQRGREQNDQGFLVLVSVLNGYGLRRDAELARSEM